MIASAGRFGPYIRYDKNKFVSIPDDITPQEVTLDQAIELIEAKKEADARKVLKTFDEDPDMKILNGRFGPYLAAGGKNYKLPKTIASDSAAIEALTTDDCRRIMEEADKAPAKPRQARRSSSRQKKS